MQTLPQDLVINEKTRFIKNTSYDYARNEISKEKHQRMPIFYQNKDYRKLNYYVSFLWENWIVVTFELQSKVPSVNETKYLSVSAFKSS